MNHRYFAIVLIMAALTSCKNDFDLIEEGEELPVVYGFVDISDTAQYIRVERAFADENTNAVLLAKEASAVYYDDVVVRLLNLNDGTSFDLSRVNAAEEGYTRDPGDFLVDPNYLYKTKTSDLNMTGGERIRLVVLKDEDTLTQSTTTLLPNVALGTIAKDQLGFTGKAAPIQIKADKSVGLIGTRLYINIRETLEADPTQFEIVQVVWDVTSSFLNDPNRVVQVLNLESFQFYKALSDQLDKSKPVIRRFADLYIEVFTSGLETVEFRRITLANGGLTGSLELPLYSNLSRGIGIFSSKNENLFGPYLVTQGTRDSLANGNQLDGYNFVF